MKILFFIGEFNGGGAERVISILANKLVEKGFDIEILKYYNSDNLYITNPKVSIKSVEENTGTRNIIKNIKWLHKHFNNNCDIIISFLAPFNMLSIISNIGNKTPIIVADRNDPRKVPNNIVMRLFRNVLYRFADGIVLQTMDNQNYFSNYIQKNSKVIHNPIDLNENVGIALKTKKDKIIVSVARLEEQKNQKMLIKAFSELGEAFNDYKLIIYGEGSYRNELEKYINNLGIKDKVYLPGNINDVINNIKNASIFVLCSNYEGMSNSLLEAMCIGLPVICTKVSGSKELIINDENGILIDINDEKQLLNALRELLSNKNKCDYLAKNAIKLNNKIDSDTICNEWIEFINTIKK